MARTVARKMGIKPGSRALLVDAPQDAVEAMVLPEIEVASEAEGLFGYIHCFVQTQAEMIRQFPVLRDRLDPAGMLWLSWPKGGKSGTDLTLPHVIRIGYEHGLVESTCLSIDTTWSGLKFTWPKPGKIYHNSHGKLPEGCVPLR